MPLLEIMQVNLDLYPLWGLAACSESNPPQFAERKRSITRAIYSMLNSNLCLLHGAWCMLCAVLLQATDAARQPTSAFTIG